MVGGVTVGIGVTDDVQILRIGPESLRHRSRKAGVRNLDSRRLCRRGSYALREQRAEREIFRVDLVDADQRSAEVSALNADICRFERGLPGKFPLHADLRSEERR